MEYRLPVSRLVAVVWVSAFCLFAQSVPDGMVLVPAGAFQMGSAGKGLDEDASERPIHEVQVASFYIDVKEVTTDAYAAFLNAAGTLTDGNGHDYLGMPDNNLIESADGGWRPRKGRENFPMVNVTWYGAMAYARWAGKRLPTEAEWEKAARGTDGRRYPWGEGADMSRLRFGQDNLGPVGGYPSGASPYGCLDMVGSVWEWTDSLFRPYPYVADDGREDSSVSERRVARGGSWTGEPHILTVTYRFRPEPGFAHRYLGFRCAKSAP